MALVAPIALNVQATMVGLRLYRKVLSRREINIYAMSKRRQKRACQSNLPNAEHSAQQTVVKVVQLDFKDSNTETLKTVLRKQTKTMSTTDFASRVRALSTASRNNTLKKSLGIGDFRLTGWLGGVNDDGTTAPRVRMETIDVEAKGLPNAIKKYMSQYKNQNLPPEAFDSETGLVIIRVESREQPRAFPAGTPVISGKVKFWKDLEGTGYITADGVDYFVHHNEVVGDVEVFKTLSAGQSVHFIPSTRKSKGEDKPIACAVTTEE